MAPMKALSPSSGREWAIAEQRRSSPSCSTKPAANADAAGTTAGANPQEAKVGRRAGADQEAGTREAITMICESP